MKIVREHLNEIKKDNKSSGLGSIGIGGKKANEDLRQIITKFMTYYHTSLYTREDKWIASKLNIPISSLMTCYTEHFDLQDEIFSLIDKFGNVAEFIEKHKKSNSPLEKVENFKFRKNYYFWHNPFFAIKETFLNQPADITIYFDKNVLNDNN